jgi:hypothetical protein
MRELIYSMGVSLDGFIAGPDGEIDWSAPDEELHRFHNQQTREIGAHFCGRRFAKLKEEPGGDLAVGGAGLASGFIGLELVETRTFGADVVYLRYRRRGG